MLIPEIYSLENAAASAANETIRLRCEAVSLRLQGWEAPAVCDELGCCERFVRKWSGIFLHEGLRALLAFSGPGRKYVIPDEALEEMKEAISSTQTRPTPARGPEIQTMFVEAWYIVGLSSSSSARFIVQNYETRASKTQR